MNLLIKKGAKMEKPNELGISPMNLAAETFSGENFKNSSQNSDDSCLFKSEVFKRSQARFESAISSPISDNEEVAKSIVDPSIEIKPDNDKKNSSDEFESGIERCSLNVKENPFLLADKLKRSTSMSRIDSKTKAQSTYVNPSMEMQKVSIEAEISDKTEPSPLKIPRKTRINKYHTIGSKVKSGDIFDAWNKYEELSASITDLKHKIEEQKGNQTQNLPDELSAKPLSEKVPQYCSSNKASAQAAPKSIEPRRVLESNFSDEKSSIDFLESINLNPDHYSTMYLKNLKKPMFHLIDDEEAYKMVKFGKSWKGNLERTKRFLTSECANSISTSPSRPRLSAQTFVSPETSSSKLFLNLISFEGMVLKFDRTPEKVSFYCVVKVDDSNPIMTKVVPVDPFFTKVELEENIELICGPSTKKVTVQLFAKVEFSKTEKKYSPKNLINISKSHLKLQVNNNTNSIDQMIGQFNLKMNEIQRFKEGSVLDKHWYWKEVEVQGSETQQTSNMTRTGSRLFEYSQSVMRRIQSISGNLRSKPSVAKEIRVRNPLKVVELGSIRIKSLFTGYMTTEELENSPSQLQSAYNWLKHREWQNTVWYEGYLNQEGGDVKFWRLRYFKAIGSRLEVYDEQAIEKRTHIDLSQLVRIQEASKDLDDENFAVPNTFRLIFKDGEYIEFYSNSNAEYEAWISTMKHVSEELPIMANWLIEEVKDSDEMYKSVSPRGKKQKKKTKRKSTGFVRSMPELDSLETEIEEKETVKNSVLRNFSPQKISLSGMVGIFGRN